MAKRTLNTTSVQETWHPHPTPVRIRNRFAATVIAQHHSQPGRYRARTLDYGTIDFVFDPALGPGTALDIGHQVTLDISPSDVTLSAPRWVSPLEGNRWPGRVVLVANPRADEAMTVVKVLGLYWTLVSTQPLGWLNRMPRAWDRLTISVPPHAVRVSRRFPGDRLRPRVLTALMSQSSHCHSSTRG